MDSQEAVSPNEQSKRFWKQGMRPADLFIRLRTALLLAPVAMLAILKLPDTSLLIVASLVAQLIFREWLILSGVKAVIRPWLIGACIAMTYLLLIGPARAIVNCIWAGAVCWIAILASLRHARIEVTRTWSNIACKALLGLIVVLSLFAAMTWLCEQPQGRYLLIFLISMVCALDSLCYLLGKFIRVLADRKPLAPKISPNKNLAVLAIAWCITAVISATILLVSQKAAPGRCLIILATTLVSLSFGVVGDLFCSLMKRQANVKDSGRMLPGHGGVMDRLDSLLAALPIFTAFLIFSR